jgi:hypothetical protein
VRRALVPPLERSERILTQSVTPTAVRSARRRAEDPARCLETGRFDGLLGDILNRPVPPLPLATLAPDGAVRRNVKAVPLGACGRVLLCVACTRDRRGCDSRFHSRDVRRCSLLVCRDCYRAVHVAACACACRDVT